MTMPKFDGATTVGEVLRELEGEIAERIETISLIRAWLTGTGPFETARPTRSHKMGRPRKEIDMTRVVDLVNGGFSIRAAGRMCGIPPSTVVKRFKELAVARQTETARS